MRVLLFGSSGQIGGELCRAEWDTGTQLIALDRQAADFSRPASLPAIVLREKPDAIIIAAAYTAVDKAEADETAAQTVNAEAPGAIAREAAELAAPVVYLSTDYVFDGGKEGAYEENDPTAPINVYGRSKLAGEEAVRAANPRHLILRTSWIYSARGTNFLLSMLKLAATRKEIEVVADQTGCPTAADDLAQTVADILPRLLRNDGPWGTYHLAGESATSWHGLATAIFDAAAARGEKRPALRAISTAEYPTAARRPLNSRLSSERFAGSFGIRLPGFKEALPRVLDETLKPRAVAERIRR